MDLSFQNKSRALRLSSRRATQSDNRGIENCSGSDWLGSNRQEHKSNVEHWCDGVGNYSLWFMEILASNHKTLRISARLLAAQTLLFKKTS